MRSAKQLTVVPIAITFQKTYIWIHRNKINIEGNLLRIRRGQKISSSSSWKLSIWDQFSFVHHPEIQKNESAEEEGKQETTASNESNGDWVGCFLRGRLDGGEGQISCPYPRRPSMFLYLHLFRKFHGTFTQFESQSIGVQHLASSLHWNKKKTVQFQHSYLFSKKDICVLKLQRNQIWENQQRRRYMW